MTSYINILKQIIFATTGLAPKPELLTQYHINYSLGLIGNFAGAPVVRATFIGREYTVENPRTEIIRSLIHVGFPYDGYYNINDRYDGQFKDLGKRGKPIIDIIDEYQEMPGLKPYVYIPSVSDNVISGLILKEVLWLIGSFLFVFVFAAIRMRTIFVSLLGVIGIFFSIPCSMAVNNGIITIHHFDALNIIGLFLICGIGSDSLFIIFDFILQTKHINVEQERRLGYSIAEGASALACSIITTAVGFLALTISHFRILQFFGVFCFFELMFSLAFALSWYIAIIAVLMRFFEKKKETEKEEKEEIIIEEFP